MNLIQLKDLAKLCCLSYQVVRVEGLEPLNIWVCVGKNVILLVYLGTNSTPFPPTVGTRLAHCAKRVPKKKCNVIY